jgi:NAD(P)-dependent dehydrogenase (short-subunit alcohol dehydrogenase family)
VSNEQSIVITGASTGIGRACAERFHQLGWRVFAGVRKDTDAAALREATSERTTPIMLDVTRQETIDEAARRVIEAVGEAGLQGLVNNAGIGVGGPVEGLDLEALRRQFEVNVFGQVRVSQAFLPLLRSGNGRIVNMSSIAGKVAQPFMAPYCGSKHALEAFTDSMREELKPWGIHVAAVEPGVIKTPIWDKARSQAGEARGEMSPRLEQLYGKATERLQDILEKLPERGIPADRVADAVEHAMTAPRPRTRYPVGTDAKIGIRLRRVLGDRAFYSVMAKLTGRG